jgi:hypothetical protein
MAREKQPDADYPCFAIQNILHYCPTANVSCFYDERDPYAAIVKILWSILQGPQFAKAIPILFPQGPLVTLGPDPTVIINSRCIDSSNPYSDLNPYKHIKGSATAIDYQLNNASCYFLDLAKFYNYGLPPCGKCGQDMGKDGVIHDPVRIHDKDKGTLMVISQQWRCTSCPMCLKSKGMHKCLKLYDTIGIKYHVQLLVLNRCFTAEAANIPSSFVTASTSSLQVDLNMPPTTGPATTTSGMFLVSCYLFGHVLTSLLHG